MRRLLKMGFWLQIAEWTDKSGFKLVETKYERLPGPVIQRNKTYIVTSILVSYYQHYRPYFKIFRKVKKDEEFD